jgi:glutathione S-transferase
MKLYMTPTTCSLAVDIVAREAGVDLQPVWVDVRAKRLFDGSDFWHLNPKGQVPMLETDDGQRLTEYTVIVQYIADLRPHSGLLPAGLSMQRYRVLEWLSFISTELHKTFTPLFRPATAPDDRETARDNLRKRFAWLDQLLADRIWLEGETFTVADACCYTIVMWSRVQDIDLSGWPHLSAYLARIAQRPSVQQALLAEQQALASR